MRELRKWLIREEITAEQLNRDPATGRNRTFQILTGCAILLVILGHLDFKVLTFGELFPYYSYHVMIFLFVSGYFFEPKKTEHPGIWIRKKILHLLVPYYVWNLVYGLLAAALRKNGFSIGEPLNFRNLVYEPFLGGHQFALHFPSWFVPALFLVQIVNFLMRKLLGLLRLEREWLILTGTFLLGITVVFLAQGGHVWGPYLLPGRILFLLPIYELGYFYKVRLEKWDRLGNVPYFAILLAIQVIVKVTCGGLAFSAVWVSSFANLPFVPYLTTITGTALWLRIAKIIAEKPGLRILDYLGQNSYGLMMHHIFGFFILSSILYVCAVSGFDQAAYLSDVNYHFLGNGALTGGLPLASWFWKSLYAAVGIGVSLGLQKGDCLLRRFLRSVSGEKRR